MSDAQTPPLAAPAHTRVFVSDGGHFRLPPDAYAGVRDAIRRGVDYEGVDFYGDPLFLSADYLRAVSARSAESGPLRVAASWT